MAQLLNPPQPPPAITQRATAERALRPTSMISDDGWIFFLLKCLLSPIWEAFKMAIPVNVFWRAIKERKNILLRRANFVNCIAALLMPLSIITLYYFLHFPLTLATVGIDIIVVLLCRMLVFQIGLSGREGNKIALSQLGLAAIPILLPSKYYYEFLCPPANRAQGASQREILDLLGRVGLLDEIDNTSSARVMSYWNALQEMTATNRENFYTLILITKNIDIWNPANVEEIFKLFKTGSEEANSHLLLAIRFLFLGDQWIDPTQRFMISPEEFNRLIRCDSESVTKILRIVLPLCDNNILHDPQQHRLISKLLNSLLLSSAENINYTVRILVHLGTAYASPHTQEQRQTIINAILLSESLPDKGRTMLSCIASLTAAMQSMNNLLQIVQNIEKGIWISSCLQSLPPELVNQENFDRIMLNSAKDARLIALELEKSPADSKTQAMVDAVFKRVEDKLHHREARTVILLAYRVGDRRHPRKTKTSILPEQKNAVTPTLVDTKGEAKQPNVNHFSKTLNALDSDTRDAITENIFSFLAPIKRERRKSLSAVHEKKATSSLIKQKGAKRRASFDHRHGLFSSAEQDRIRAFEHDFPIQPAQEGTLIAGTDLAAEKITQSLIYSID